MKKITLIIVTVVLCAAMIAGCSAPAAVPSESAAESASQPVETTEPTADQSAATDTDYMSWTGAEWNAATGAEQFAATEAVLLAIGDSIMDNYTQLVEEAKTNEAVKEQIDAQVKSLQGTIDTFFENSPEATLSQLVEASKQAAEGMAS